MDATAHVTDQWQRLQALFQAALGRDGDDRRAYVADACAGDEAMRLRLEQLLRDNDRAGALLDVPPADVAGSFEGAAGDEMSAVPARVGPYLIRQLIGSGGMGIVYEAEQ